MFTANNEGKVDRIILPCVATNAFCLDAVSTVLVVPLGISVTACSFNVEIGEELGKILDTEEGMPDEV